MKSSFRQSFLLLFSIASMPSQVCFAQVWKWVNPLPQGDNIRQISFVNPSRGWIVVGSNSLLHTYDGGETWELVPSNINLRRVLFVTETEGWGIGSEHPFAFEAGVYHTTNGGLHWVHQLTDTVWGPFEDVTFTDPLNGWALGRGFLWHSGDGGMTWSRQATTDFVRPAGGDYAISFRDSLRGWMGGWQYFASKTLDGGKSWQRDSSLEGYNRYNFVDSLNGWASSTRDSWTRRAIATTSDGGLTWIETSSPLIALAHPLNSEASFAIADDGIYITTNRGDSWNFRSGLLTDDGCVTCDLKDGLFQSATKGWVFRSNGPNLFQTSDGGSNWHNRTFNTFGPGTSPLHDIDFVDTSYGWIVGSRYSHGTRVEGFVARTTDGGSTWARIALNLPDDPLAVSFHSRSIGWIAGGNGMIRTTTDGGVSWQLQVTGSTYTLRDIQFADSLIGFAAGYGSDNGIILKTTDGGAQWMDISPSDMSKVDQIQFVDGTYGWVVGDHTNSLSPPVFLKTTDAGNSWSDPLVDSTMRLDRMCFIDRMKGWAKGVDPNNPGTYRIVSTTDGGSNWSIKTENILPTGLYDGEVSFSDSLNGWVVGGLGGVLSTTDGGETWENRSGTNANGLKAIDVVGSGRALIVGEAGVILCFNKEGSVLVPREDETPIPDEMIVSNNYPNPFNGQTTFLYTVGKAGHVRFELFDLLGRMIVRKEEGYRDVGQHSLRLQADGLTTGTYFLRVIGLEMTSDWRKVVLIR